MSEIIIPEVEIQTEVYKIINAITVTASFANSDNHRAMGVLTSELRNSLITVYKSGVMQGSLESVLKSKE